MPARSPAPSSTDFANAMAMNEALIISAVRHHEIAEAAESLNTQLEKTVRELGEKARLLDLSNDAIIVSGVDGRITSWNQGAEKLYGWASTEVLGHDLDTFLHTEFSEPHAAIHALLHRAGQYTGEVFQRGKTGRRLSCLGRWVLDRETESILTSYTDITERKRVEKALRESEEFNRSIVESNRDCLKVLDLEGNLLMMTPLGQELLCIDDLEPYMGKSWIDFFGEEDRAAARQAVATAVAGGTGNFVGFFRTLRGDAKWWDVVISPIRGAGGQTERLLAVSRDVTERRAQDDALATRAEDFAQADRSKDEFLAMLAHELRNPLAPLRNAAAILQTAEAGPEASAMACGILNRQIENMSQMLDDLLDVSRITEGKIALRLQVVALADVLHAAASLARPGIEARGHELVITLPEEPVFLRGDATRLDQIFGNLLTNACKYSAPGGHLSITAEFAPSLSAVAALSPEETAPREVIVRVRDDGLGIAAELLPRIFDLFVQATRSLDRTHGGLGIGLTLVQRLVKLHGGSVSAYSAGLGHGSEFTVRLPVLADSGEALAPVAPPAVRETPRRMLIVDDNEDSATSMATLQHLRGHETRTAFTGPTALAIAAEFVPDVVLLDIGLPGMDGYEVAAQIRAMPALAGAFIVAMSGYGSPEEIARARAAGFDEYLVKPADLDLLRVWLRQRA